MAEEKHIHNHPRDYWWVPTDAIPCKKQLDEPRDQIAFDPWEYLARPHSNQQRHDQGSSAETKKTWPEVVGLTIEEAENIIKQDKPDVHFQIVEPSYEVKMDIRPKRVRFFVDFSGKVQLPPTAG